MPQIAVHRWKQLPCDRQLQRQQEGRQQAASRKQEAAEEGTEAEPGSLSVARAQVFLFLSLPSYLSCNKNYFSSTAFILLIFPFLPASSDGTIAPRFQSQWAKRLELQQRWYQLQSSRHGWQDHERQVLVIHLHA